MSDNRELAKVELRIALGCLEREDTEGAIIAAEKALSLAPGFSFTVHVLGLIASRMGETLRAEALFRHAYDLDPSNYEHCEALAIVSAGLNRLQDALFFGKMAGACERTQELDGMLPSWFGTFEAALYKIDRDNAYEKARRIFENEPSEEAVAAFQKAAETSPTDVRCWRGLRDSLAAIGRWHDALVVSQALAEMPSADDRDLSVTASILTQMGRFEEAQGCYFKAVEEAPQMFDVRTLYLRDFQLTPNVSIEEYLNALSLWEDTFSRAAKNFYRAPGTAASDRFALDREQQPTIAIVSGRFGHSSIQYALDFLATVSAQFSFYTNAPCTQDQLPEAFAASEIVEIRRFDDETAAKVIAGKSPDILIDLDGFVASGRPGVVAFRPAKNVVSWFGQPISESRLYDWFIGAAGLQAASGERVALSHLKPSAAPGTVMSSGARIGLVANSRKLSRDVATDIASLRKETPDIRVVVSPDQFGSVLALDQLEALLGAFNLLDALEYSETVEMAGSGTAMEILAAACDILVDPGPDGDVGALEAAIKHGCAYFGCVNGFVQNQQTMALLKAIGADDLCVETSDALWARVRIALDDGGVSAAAHLNQSAAAAREAGFSKEVASQFVSTVIGAR